MASRLVISLLRHGMTIGNERREYIGWTDSPLSVHGKSQLQMKNYTDLKTQIVFSSPLQRCVETAAILFPNKKIIKIEELKEMNFGAWEAKTYNELQDIPAYRKWLDDIFTQPIERGETYKQFSERIALGLHNVYRLSLEKKTDRAAVVTHGGVIRNILHTLFPEEKSFFDWEIPYGAGYEITWPREKLRGDERQCTLLAVAPTMVKQIG